MARSGGAAAETARASEDVEAHYLSRRAFLAGCEVDQEACRFFWPTSEPRPSRPLVVVRVSFRGLEESFRMRAKVVATRQGGVSGTGLVLEPLGADLEVFCGAYAFACGRPALLGRRVSERREVSLAARLRLPDGQTVMARVVDLSLRGAGLRAEGHRLRVGNRVVVEPRTWFRSLHLPGSVRWVRPIPGGAALGVELRTLEPGARRWLQGMLKRRGR